MQRYSEKFGETVTVQFTNYDEGLSFIESNSGEQAIVRTEFDLRPERCGPEIYASSDKFHVKCYCGQMKREGYSTGMGATQAWIEHRKSMD